MMGLDIYVHNGQNAYNTSRFNVYQVHLMQYKILNVITVITW